MTDIAVRRRACGVVIADAHLLMVRHIHDGRDYWTLPGGGIEAGESVLAAAKREVLEETGLSLEPDRALCVFRARRSHSHCVLMHASDRALEPVLGIDPEEAHLPVEQRMLQAVAFKPVIELLENAMVKEVLQALQTGEAHP